jgi:hypothetical protein
LLYTFTPHHPHPRNKTKVGLPSIYMSMAKNAVIYLASDVNFSYLVCMHFMYQHPTNWNYRFEASFGLSLCILICLRQKNKKINIRF